MSTWKLRKNYPQADQALAIARALETTVEYLAEGEEGADYVRSLVAREGRLWKPPPHLEAVVRALEALDDDQLHTVHTVAMALSGEDPAVQKVQGS